MVTVFLKKKRQKTEFKAKSAHFQIEFISCQITHSLRMKIWWSAGLYYQCKYVMPRAYMHDLETDELYKLKCAIKFLLRLQITLYNVN